MEVNGNAASLAPRGALTFFASKLAPTGSSVSAKKGLGDVAVGEFLTEKVNQRPYRRQ